MIAAEEEFSAVQAAVTSQVPSLSRTKQLELCAAIEQYRLTLLDDLESPPLFSIEVVTGITNQLSKDIANNTQKYISEDVFLSLSMTRCQAGELFCII